MKKACASIVLFLCVGGVIACAVLFFGFFLSMGTTYETSVSQYGAWEDDLEDVPSFLPESIEGYTVNAQEQHNRSTCFFHCDTPRFIDCHTAINAATCFAGLTIETSLLLPLAICNSINTEISPDVV